MPHPPQQIVRWHPLTDVASLHVEVAARTLDAATRAIADCGRFTIVLAGGSTPRGVYERLAASAADWPRWHIYFGDERCVSPSSDERNSRMARLAWLDRVPIPPEHVHEIQAELGPTEGAARYLETLSTVADFDLVLLGLGEDGHVGSLFPCKALGSEPGDPSVLPVFDSPKPPPDRVTLSAARFSRARETFFIVAGADKQAAVTRWRRGENIPATSIRPRSGVDVFIESELIR